MGLYLNGKLVGISLPQQNSGGGDIITATNNTGSVISAGDKVWIEKVSNRYNIVKYGASISLLNNIDIVGKPTISSDCVVSGFTSGNYLQGSSSETIDGFDTLHCTSIIKFNTGTLYSNNSFIFEPNFCPGLQLSKSLLYWNGSSLMGILSPQANTDYWIKTEVLGTTVNFYYSLDGETYTFAQTGTVSGMSSNNFILLNKIGYASWVARSFGGTIDLKELKVFNENGTLVWKAIRDDNIFTGITTEDIAVNGSGQVKTVLPE